MTPSLLINYSKVNIVPYTKISLSHCRKKFYEAPRSTCLETTAIIKHFYFLNFSFSFKACCSIEPYEESGHSSSSTQPLNLIYTIEAETYNNLKKFSRVYFGPDTRNRSNTLRKHISVITDGRQECREEVVYIKDNTRDIQNPIRFRLNYTILDTTLPASALDTLDPILDQTQADRTFEATFQKDCGHDGICQSKIDVKAKLSLEQQGI